VRIDLPERGDGSRYRDLFGSIDRPLVMREQRTRGRQGPITPGASFDSVLIALPRDASTTQIPAAGHASAEARALSRSDPRGYVDFDVPVIRKVTTQSGRGFMVPARFTGKGSIYSRKQ
jgi:hypothetical protein